jgi:hypothetical protein
VRPKVACSTLKAETRCNANHADPLHPLGLLRARRERPR